MGAPIRALGTCENLPGVRTVSNILESNKEAPAGPGEMPGPELFQQVPCWWSSCRWTAFNSGCLALPTASPDLLSGTHTSPAAPWLNIFACKEFLGVVGTNGKASGSSWEVRSGWKPGGT